MRARWYSGIFFVVMGLVVLANALRSKGIGSLLLERIETEIGGTPSWCLPYTHLERFYARIGFRAVGRDQAPAFVAARVGKYLAAGHEVRS